MSIVFHPYIIYFNGRMNPEGLAEGKPICNRLYSLVFVFAKHVGFKGKQNWEAADYQAATTLLISGTSFITACSTPAFKVCIL